jgi:hypothetical protein
MLSNWRLATLWRTVIAENFRIEHPNKGALNKDPLSAPKWSPFALLSGEKISRT